MTISLAEIEAEDLWIRQWGLRPPARGLLLENPWRQPFEKRSLIVPHTWYGNARKTDPLINTSALRADIPLLTEVMRVAFSGWERDGYSAFWDGFRAEWSHELERYTAPVSPSAAFRKWIEMQRRWRDHHTGPVIARLNWQSFSRVAVLPPGTAGVTSLRRGRDQFAVAVGNAAAQPWPARRIRPGLDGFEPVSLIAYPVNSSASPAGLVDAVLANGLWVDAEPLEMSSRRESILAITGQDPELPCFTRIAPGVGYLRIPTLSVSVCEAMVNFKEWIPRDVDVGRSLIVDLRGNKGGAAVSAIGPLCRLLGEGALERGLRFGFRLKKSCITGALSWGHAQAQLLEAAPPLSDAIKTQLQSILDGIECPDEFGASSFEERAAEWNYTQRTGSGTARVLILTDGECGSDGEFLVWLLASVPGSMVLGANTAGCAQFIRPGYFVLPESQIVFRVAMGATDLYGDGRAFDGYGLQVDVVLPREIVLNRETLMKIVALAAR